MDNINKLFKQIKHKLLNTRRLFHLNNFVWGVIISLISFQSIVLILSALEHFGHFPSEVRLFYYGLTWLAFLVPFGIWALPELLKMFGIVHSFNLDELAFIVGQKFNDIQDKLSNSIQLYLSLSSQKGISTQLALASFQEVYEYTRHKNFNVIIDYKKNIKALLYLFLFSALFIGSFKYLDESIGKGYYRIKNWQMSFIPPAPFKFEINPKFAKVLYNSDVKIQIKAIGQAPESIKLYIKEKETGEFDHFTLRLDTGNTYNFNYTNIVNSLEFYAEADWLSTQVKTEIGRIIVYEKPFVRSINGTLNYPSYTKLEPRSINEQNADLTALVGSVANFSLVSNKNLKSAKIVVIKKMGTDSLSKADTNYIPMKIIGKNANGSLRVSFSGSYYFSITDSLDEVNDEPVNYGIIALTDEYPSISMIQPTMDVKLNEDAILPMVINISDDYGFSSLNLYYKLVYSKYTQPDKNYNKISIPIIYNGNNVDIPYVWNLKGLDIVPEDRFEFYCEVADNDIINGPKKARTQSFLVVLPSIDEVLQTSEQKQEYIQKELENVMKQTRELQKEIENFNRELKQDQSPNLNWEQQKKAQDILRQQEQIKSKVRNLEKQLNQNTENLRQNNLISQETLQKYLELQKLMKEINSPELQRLQQEMQKALQQMNQKQLEEALKNFQFNEEQFRKSIERTMNILKRLQLEQKIDALNRKAEKMQDQMEEMQRKANNKNLSPDDNKNLQKQAEQLKDDISKVDKELQDIEKLMKQFDKDDMPIDELNEAQQALDAEEMQQEMQEISSDFQKNNSQSASQKIEKNKKKLANFKNKMQNLKQKMDEKSSKEAIRQMQKAINDMLTLSKKQEDLNNRTQKTDYNSTNLPNLGREQMNQFEGLMRVAERLAELSERSFAVTPEMGEQIATALQNMSQAIENFTDRNLGNITNAQQGALGNMNSAIAQMQQMLQAMQQSNGTCPNPGGQGQNSMGQGSGFGQKLQQLAAQQQALNQMMQQMLAGGSGNQMGMTQEQQAQYQRIMKNQQEAQKTLEQLQNEAKQYGNTPEGRRLQNELNNLQKEMQETLNDINQHGIRPENVRKQERILAKLLDLYNSQNEKDIEKRREGREAKNFNVQSPAEIDMSTQEGRQALMELMLRQSTKQYSPDYQEMIKMYFNGLSK